MFSKLNKIVVVTMCLATLQVSANANSTPGWSDFVATPQTSEIVQVAGVPRPILPLERINLYQECVNLKLGKGFSIRKAKQQCNASLESNEQFAQAPTGSR